MYLKHLIVTPIHLKVNQSNNKTIDENVEDQQKIFDNNKTFKSCHLNKQI